MITIKGIENLKRLAAELKESATAEVNLRGLEKDISGVIARQNAKQFDTSTGPDGQRWRERKNNKSPRPILVDTGQLRDSLTKPQVSLEDNGRRIVTRFSGPHIGLAAIHSAGAPSRGLPSRPVGGFSQESKDQITKIAFSKISSGFAKRLKSAKVR